MGWGQESLSRGRHKQSGFKPPYSFDSIELWQTVLWHLVYSIKYKYYHQRGITPWDQKNTYRLWACMRRVWNVPTALSQTFPLTSTVTAVNLECGTRPEWRNSERELLTFVQSHDGRKGPGQPLENKLYLQQKRTFLFVFHIASTCIKQTSKQTRLMNTEISTKKSLPRDLSEE